VRCKTPRRHSSKLSAPPLPAPPFLDAATAAAAHDDDDDDEEEEEEDGMDMSERRV